MNKKLFFTFFSRSFGLACAFVAFFPAITGFVFLVKQEQTVDPGWTVEEALKMVISAGIISPASIKRIN